MGGVMNETHVTVVGNVATPVEYRTTESGVPVARFRLASTVRRFDPQDRTWGDAGTSFYTVWARRSLAENVASSVTRGEPVIVTGQLRIQEYTRDEKRHVDAQLSASSVGHDLTLGTSAFLRVSRVPRFTSTGARPGAGERPSGEPQPAGAVSAGKVPGQPDAGP